MSSTRLTSLGFLLCMVLLPSMLLAIVRGHADAEAGGVIATVASPAGDGAAPRAWAGTAKSPAPAGQAKTEPASAAAAKGAALVELYLADAEAAKLASEILAAQPGSLVLAFGASQTKTEAGNGIDPYVGVEAGKRRRAYGRAAADGRETIGPVVVVSPIAVAGPDKPTATWAREAANAASAQTSSAELTLKVARPEGQKGDAGWQVQFAAKGSGAHAALPEDAMLNLLLVEQMGTGTGTPLRVISFKCFQLPKGGAGSMSLSTPTGSMPSRLIAVLQHGKTMRTLATASANLE